MVRGERGSVVTVEALAHPVGGDRVAQGVQEISRLLVEGEAATHDHATVIIDYGTEDRLAFPLRRLDPGAVHEVTHPQVIGMRHLILGPCLSGAPHSLVQPADLQEAA